MRVLCINHEFPPVGGGGATACKNISRQLPLRGHSVSVVTVGYPGSASNEVIDGVTVYRLNCLRKHKDHSTFMEMLSFLWAAFLFVPKLLKKERFDVVHIYFGIPSGPLGWYLKHRFGIPYIIRLGGGDVPGTQKRFGVVYKLTGPFLKKIWSSAGYVVANSEGLMMRAKGFYDQASFAVIPNGININDYPTLRYKSANKVFRVITTTRIVERKGLQHIVRALPKLIEATDGQVRYTIVGDGPYRPAIEALAKELDVEKYITISGVVPFAQVLQKLADADVFALTSHWEGMPNVVLEAMAMHLPIIMSSCEGSQELITDNGFIIDLEDDIASKFTSIALELYRNPLMATEMGEKGYRKVCENFTWTNTADKYYALYRQLVPGKE